MSHETLRVCPKCHKAYKGHPAISRVDNQTPICPRCGSIEALDALGISEDEKNKILGEIKTFDDEKK